MKKIIVAFLALILTIGITACNTDSNIVKNNDIDLVNNITKETAFGADGRLIVVLNNNNSKNVKLEIEVFIYDEANDITDIEADIIHMKANSEFAYEIREVYSEQEITKFSVKAEEDKINYQTTDLIISNEVQTEESINFKVKNNSAEMLEYMTAVVVFYKDGKIIGLNETGETNVEPDSSAEMLATLPTDSNYNKVDFDDYKIIVHGITYKND